jgi:tetratricopeptide (TPR) repeat protein/predicted membrane-bound spermidine synthase
LLVAKPRVDLIALAAVLFAALLSGGASLSYEVVWSRMLVVPLGNSADATAMVLSSFMAGIAVGAVILGRTADRITSPLRLYAILEAALGLLAFVVPMLIHGIDHISALRGGFEDRPLAAVGRPALAGLLVFLPSLVMGATIPVLIRALSRASSDIRNRIGPIYGINTIGAATGAAFTGFIAIPNLGFTLTSATAALCNFSAAAIVLIVRKRFDNGRQPTRNVVEDPGEKPLRAAAWAALIAAGVSGAAMLSAEVLWSRVLTFVFGHDTYAFAALLAIVLLGLGIGGIFYRKLVKYDPHTVCIALLGLLGAVLIGSYWTAATVVTKLGRDPFALSAVGALSASLRLEFYREILYTPVLVLLPSIVSGALFPAACALFSGPVAEAGSRVGIASLVNGVGSAAGSLLTSFLLVGTLGIQRSLIASALLASVAAITCAVLRFSPGKRKGAVVAAIPSVVTVVCALLIPAALSRAMLEEAVGDRYQDLLFYEEGRTGTVSVTKNTINDEKQLFMNAVNEVTTRLVHDQSFKLLGHLGPLLHPNPKNGAMVCLGAGLSAGAALVHPLATLDVVELSSTIPKAAALWGKENNHVLEDSRFHLHIEDGRHFLLSTDKRFDVIMVDSTHPKAVDSWILYTKEFYELVSRRLKNDGIAVQWLPLHGLSEREFKIIVRTFYEVFKEATLWVNVGFEAYGQAAYVKLVASKKPLVIDYKEFSLRMKEPQIARDLAPFGMDDPVEVLDSYLAGPAAVNMWTAGLPVQTDDRPMVPYTTLYSTGRRMSASLLLSARSSILNVLVNMGQDEGNIRKRFKQAEEAQGFLLSGMLDRAVAAWPEGKKNKLFQAEAKKGHDYYLALAKKYADKPSKLFEIGSLLGNLGFTDDAVALYLKAHKAEPRNAEYTINLALAKLDEGETDEAARLLEKVLQDEPDNTLAQYNLGVVLNRMGRSKDAISYLETAVSLIPDLMGARLALALALLNSNRIDEAEARLIEITDENPFVADAWDMLGLVAGRRKDWEQAKDRHLRAVNIEPYRADSHYNVGIAFEELGRLTEAALAYQAALRIAPNDAEAENNLGLVYARAGRYELAAEAHRKALDIEPQYPEAAYNLGLAYVAQGKIVDAAESFAIALTLNPNLEPAKKQLAELQPKLQALTSAGAPMSDTDTDAVK